MKVYFISVLLIFFSMSVTKSNAQTDDNLLKNKILIILHMQEDSVKEQKNLAEIENINALIEKAPVENVVYVKANHKILNLTLKKIFVSNNINELDTRIKLVNDNIFIDEGYDGFKSDELRDFIRTSNINELIIVGKSAEGCIKKTVLSGLKKGYDMYIATDAIVGNSPEGKMKALNKLLKKGVKELNL